MITVITCIHKHTKEPNARACWCVGACACVCPCASVFESYEHIRACVDLHLGISCCIQPPLLIQKQFFDKGGEGGVGIVKLRAVERQSNSSSILLSLSK